MQSLSFPTAESFDYLANIAKRMKHITLPLIPSALRNRAYRHRTKNTGTTAPGKKNAKRSASKSSKNTQINDGNENFKRQR